MFLNKVLQILFVSLRVLGIVLVIGVLVGFVALKLNWKLFYWQNDAVLPSGAVTGSTTPKISPTLVHIDTTVESIKDDTINEPQTDNFDNEFVTYFKKINDLTDNVWSGDEYEQIKVTISQFTADEIKGYKEWLDYEKSLKTIPSTLTGLYLNTSETTSIKTIIKGAQSDYIKYLRAVNIKNEYISELETNTIPINDSRIVIKQTNLLTDPESAVEYLTNDKGEVENNDYSKLRMAFIANDIYRTSRILKAANILDDNYFETLTEKETFYRDMSIRFITFKLMTNGLQRAVDTVNSPDKYKTDKDSYLKAINSLSAFENEYELLWGGVIYNQVNNRSILLRRQANYVAFEVLVSAYDMSSVQRQNLYTTLWEVFDELGDGLRIQITRFNDNYPKYPLDNLRSKLISDFIARIDPKNINKPTISEVNAYFSKITNFVADYTAFSETEAYNFWEYLK